LDPTGQHDPTPLSLGGGKKKFHQFISYLLYEKKKLNKRKEKKSKETKKIKNM
jgi:hypothetical protein